MAIWLDHLLPTYYISIQGFAIMNLYVFCTFNEREKTIDEIHKIFKNIHHNK